MKTLKINFDAVAHLILTELFDDTEAALVRNGECAPLVANDRLCRYYVEQVSDLLIGAQWHTFGDERTGISIFLHKLKGGKNRLRSGRTRKRCVTQLLNYPNVYFSNYIPVLTVCYVAELATLKTLDQIMMSGIVKLAAKEIRGARYDLRRKLRTLSDGRDWSIVDDNTMNAAQDRLAGNLLQIVFDKTQ